MLETFAITHTGTETWEWITGFVVLVAFALALAYEVHWLLVKSDYKDYRGHGGLLGLLAFRRLRQTVKGTYCRQRMDVALHRSEGDLPPSLGQFVHEIEQGQPTKRTH